MQIVSYKPAVGGDNVTTTYELFVVQPTQATIDWETQKASLRPSMIPLDAWDAVWQNLRPRLGDTLADFWNVLTADSEKLASSGESLNAIDDLLNFEIQKANNLPALPVAATVVDVSLPAPGLPLVFSRSMGDTIAGRYQLGRLGRGWTDNYNISIREDSTTHLVTLSTSGGARYFKGQDDGSYTNALGEFATLTKKNGVFQLRETTGAADGVSCRR